MTDPFPAKTMFVLSCTFSRSTGSIRVMLHLKALLTIINWTTLSNNLSSPPLSESCRQYVPTPPPAQHGMRKRCLDPSSRSHQPVATCLVGGGSRGGGGMALYKWSFGHQQELSGLFWVKYRQQNKSVCQIACIHYLVSVIHYFRFKRNRAVFAWLFRQFYKDI